jgi:hypothetical protein
MTSMLSSRSCLSPTGLGAPVIISAAFCFFGNAMQSRIISKSPKSMTTRSIPSAIPPCGGAPYFNASSKSPTRLAVRHARQRLGIVHDYHGEDYYQQSPTNDPTGPTSGSSRVLRGGSWYDGSRDTRSANRIVRGREVGNFEGFRVVRELD